MASLGADLAAIREKLGLNIEDIQQRTKLSPNVIRSIEDDSIFDDLNTNKTYIRSYVRSYAKALAIDDLKIVEALNRTETGEYGGNLKNIKGRSALRQPDGNETEDKMVHDHLPEAPSPGVENNNDDQKEFSKKETIDWAKFSQKTIPGRREPLASGKLLSVLIIIILAALAVFLYVYFNNDAKKPPQEPTSSISQPITPADSVKEALLPKAETVSEPVATAASLPDTLNMAVVAANGKLEPVRVYTDLMGIRRPYWVELHDTLRFAFVDTFRVRATDQFERMQLMFNGHIIKNAYDRFYSSESGMIELNRSLIEDHPEWTAPFVNEESL